MRDFPAVNIAHQPINKREPKSTRGSNGTTSKSGHTILKTDSNKSVADFVMDGRLTKREETALKPQ